jgi:hypothetical protein
VSRRVVTHLRSNVVAYLALFVALGGTSYAALNLPANSVGTKQLKNGAVTPAKLDPTNISGSVRAWAEITPMPKPKVVEGKDVSEVKLISLGTEQQIYKIIWKAPLPRSCPAVASVDSTHTFTLAPYGYAVVAHSGGHSTYVETFQQADGSSVPMGVNVAVIC